MLFKIKSINFIFSRVYVQCILENQLQQMTEITGYQLIFDGLPINIINQIVNIPIRLFDHQRASVLFHLKIESWPNNNKFDVNFNLFVNYRVVYNNINNKLIQFIPPIYTFCHNMTSSLFQVIFKIIFAFNNIISKSDYTVNLVCPTSSVSYGNYLNCTLEVSSIHNEIDAEVRIDTGNLNWLIVGKTSFLLRKVMYCNKYIFTSW